MTSTPNQDSPRAFTCLNCQTHMKLDTSLRKFEERPGDVDSQDGLSGESKNLLKIICDADVPTNAPLCKECSDELMLRMDRQLASLEEECVAYKKAIDELRNDPEFADVAEQKRTLMSLKAEEARLDAELKQLTDKENELDKQQISQKKQLEVVTGEEKELWRQFRDNHRQLLDSAETASRIDAELRYANDQHKKLCQLNVLDMCFHIWVDSSTDGTIGTINGMRLGRLPDVPVDWPEINAAWGQAVLLLDVLLQRVGVKQESMKLFAMGSYSYIQTKRASGDVSTAALHGSGSWKPFGNHNVDQGILAFLQCFEQLCVVLRAHDPAFTLSFPMNMKKGVLLGQGVMEYSAKMSFNSEERWTKAMKMLLTNLKTSLLQVAAIRPPS